MYRVILRIERVPSDIGPQMAADITHGFKGRTWHEKAICSYEDGGLTLTSENDFDFNGLATQDEFSDEFSANLARSYDNDGNLRVVSVSEF
jgi:hypothetical protein